MLKKYQWEQDNGGINRGPLVSSNFMRLDLDIISGNERMPKFHDVLCFTIDSARPLLSECMFCIHDRCSAKSKSLKSTNLGTCFATSHMLHIQDNA